MNWDTIVHTLFPPELGPQLQQTLLALTGGLTLLVLAGGIALLGWILATILSRAAQTLLSLSGIDAPAKRLAAGTDLKPDYFPSRLVGYGVFWLTILATAVVALRVVGLDLAPSIVMRLQDVVPRVVTSALVLLLGIPLAVAASRLLNALLLHSGVRPNRFRSQSFTAVLVAFAVLMALEQLGLAAQLIMAIAIAGVAAAGLALALAFGLGCRDLARDLIVEYLRASDEGHSSEKP